MNAVIFLKYVRIIDKKAFCKECGGSAICPHNRRKYNCKECIADKDNTIPKIEEYSKEEYEIISFLTKKMK